MRETNEDFAKLCDYVARNFTGYAIDPGDELLHTSDFCRKHATAIFDLLGLWDDDEDEGAA